MPSVQIDQHHVDDIAALRDTMSRLERELAALKQKHALADVLRAAIDRSANGVLLTDANGDIVYANNTFTELAGFPLDELIGQNPRILRDEPADPAMYQDLWRTITAGRTWRGQFHNCKKNGEQYWVFNTITPIVDETHTITHYLAITDDVTAQERAERASKEHEARYQVLIEMLPDVVLVYRDDIVIYANPAAMQLVGADHVEQILGRSIYDFIHPEAHDTVRQRMDHLRTGGLIPLREIRYVRLDGEPVLGEMISAPIEYDGQPAVMSVGRDMTSRRQTEAALRASEARNRVMLETIPDLIFRMTGDGDYLDVKESALVPTIQPRELLIGRNVRDVLQPHEAEESLARVRATLSADTLTSTEFSLVINDENRHFESRMVKSGDNEVLSVVRDITDRKNAEHQSLALALERERVDLLTNFITTVSHEFRTPLSVIGLKAYLLHNDVTSEKRDSYFKDITDQIAVLSNLVSSMTAMMRIERHEEFERQPMNFGLFLHMICANMHGLANNAGLSLECDINVEALPRYNGNVEYLRRVFEGLLHNAIRFTPAGGTITVRTSCENDAISVVINDTGIGMAKDQAQRIFERFYRGDVAHSTRGLGLGLPLAKLIVERHGGTIELDTAPGKGSTFRVTLPLLAN